MLAYRIFLKKTDLAKLKSDVDKLDFDKSKNVASNLSNLKSKVDTLDIAKLETTPVHLCKLSNVVKSNVAKETEYDELVKKVSAIQNTDTSNLVQKTDYNTKINEIEKKTTYHDYSNKYITTQEFSVRKFCFRISTSQFCKQK